MHDTTRLTLAAAALKAIREVVDAKDAEVRDVLTAELVATYHATGYKSRDVLLDGAKVAAVTLSIPKRPEPRVADDAAVLAWFERNRPDAVMERVERYVAPGAVRDLIAELVPTDDGLIDRATGEIVPGIVQPPTPAPKSYSVRYADGGREALLDRWRSGALAPLDDVLALDEGSDDD